MNILITGSSGFIGINLLKYIKNKNIYCIYHKNKPKLKMNGVKFYKIDLANETFYKKKFKNIYFDILIHLAWHGIPDLDTKNSFINLNLSLNLLAWAIREKKCKKIITTGSCFEYFPKKGKCDENMQIENNSVFTWAKSIILNYIKFLSKTYSFEYYWLRLFYVYGPYQRTGSLIPYIHLCKEQKKTPDLKTPKNCNDFIHVYDVCRLISEIIKRKIKSGIYNVGSGNLTSVKSIVKKNCGINLNIKPEFKKAIYSNNKKVFTNFRWRPKFDILKYKPSK